MGSGPDLIVLHGLFGSHQNWQPIARRLSGHFRVHLVDLRNHGKSPHQDQVNYPLMAEDVRSFMRLSGIKRAHLLGHSLGGKVAMQFALLHPQELDSLVVVDIAPRAYESVHDSVFAALRGLHLSRIRTRTEADEALASAIPHHAMRRFLLTNLVPATRGGGFRWRINLDALYAQREQLNAAVTGMVPFERPTLFVCGGNSDYVTDPDQVLMQTLFPAARIETIPGAGHWVHVDAMEPFLNCVLEFLTPVSAGQPLP
jgi:pimeloyl-ACP methyl ester carboxylesterase